MKDGQSKPLPASSADVPKGVGFGKIRSSGAEASIQPTGADLPPKGSSGKPGANQGREDAALFQEALEAARSLKRKYRGLYFSDQRAFRALIRKAHAKVFRLKPGPKPDCRIAKAARDRAAGCKWPSLYRYIPHYDSMPEFTRDLAEAGFRRKVTDYLRHHPYLRRRSLVKTGSVKPRRSS